MSSQQKPQGRVVDLDKMPESFKAGLTRDPAVGIKGMPPNLGRDVLPHVSTVQSYYGTQSKVYRPSDEALKHSTENSRFMRNDCAVMECLESRQRGTALLNWHLAPEREDSPEQQALADEVTRILERTPRFTEYRRTLLDALWYGRHAIANVYKKDRVGGQWRTVVGDWQPRNGDKLVFRYDDGRHRYREGQVGIRVGAGISDQDKRRVVAEGLEESKVEATGNGLAYFLDDWERRLMVLHHHMVEDGAYEDPEGQGAVFGVGIRSRIYWTWYQSQEVLAHLLEYLERSAFGIEIWKYPAGNATAESQTRKAAEQRIGGGRSIVLVPVATGEDPGLYLPEHIEPGLGGVDACFRMVQEFYNHRIKRYILGQVLTSEAEATGLGSGVADAHLATYADIVRYDAVNLSESLTTDLVRPVQLWNFPGSEHIRLQFVIDTTSPDATAQIEAAKTMHEMGVPLKTDEVRSLGGFTKPEAGDDVLQKQEGDNPLAALMGGGGGLGGQQVDPSQGADTDKYERIWRTIGEGKGTKIQLDSQTGEVLKGGPPELRGKNIRDAKQIFDDLNSKRKFNNANDSLADPFEGGTFEGEMQTRGRGNPKFREDSDPFKDIDWEEEDHSQPLPEDAEQDQLMDNLRAMSDYKPQRRPPKKGSPLDKALDAVGDNPTHRAILRDAIEDAHKLAQSEARDHNEAIDGVLSAVIKQPKHRGAFLRQIARVEDPSTVQGFDKMVDAAEKYYPQILAGYQGESVGEGDTEYALFAALQEGKRQIPAKHHPDVVDTALSWLSQAPAEVVDVEEEWEPFSRRGYAEKYARILKTS